MGSNLTGGLDGMQVSAGIPGSMPVRARLEGVLPAQGHNKIIDMLDLEYVK
jgi:hypothetical protein